MQMSFRGCMVTHAVVHLYSGLLASYKKEWALNAHTAFDESLGNDAEGKSHPKRLQTITLDTVLK